MKRKSRKNCRGGYLHLRILHVLVWLAVVAAVVVLFRYRTQRFEVLGIAQGQVRQVSAPCDGLLKVVSVELFEKVHEGQILAMLHDGQLNAQIATVCAEIEHLMAQLVPTQDTMFAEAADREINWDTTLRRFSVDVESTRLRILGLKTVLETDRIMLEDLGLEVKITQELLEEEAIAPYELQKAEALYNALAKKIEENGHLLAQAERDLRQARQRRDEFAQSQPYHPSADNALDAIRKEISVQEKLIDELLVQRKSLTIISPIDGMVVQIQVNANQAALRRPGEDVLRRPGEVVLAGDPILVVAEETPREIIAYAAEEQLGNVKETMVVELIKNTRPYQIASSQVLHLGPTMEIMPERLWRNPNIAQWGRPMLIKIPPGLKLIPGELVGIRGL